MENMLPDFKNDGTSHEVPAPAGLLFDDGTATSIAIIGGGLTGISVKAGLVRAAIDQNCKNVRIAIYERAPEVASGLAYATNLPHTFTLNHHATDMGSVNPLLRNLDKTDFFRWTQENLGTEAPRYPQFDLTDEFGYPPRALYGRYLGARSDETDRLAECHGITITLHRVNVTDIRQVGNRFVVVSGEQGEIFDKVVLATGNWYEQYTHFNAVGRAFVGTQWQSLTQNDAIANNAVMLISGMGLTAVDAAIFGLDSGKYSKVIMSSRNGVLRHVRGRIAPYERKFLTLANLQRMAGANQPLRLDHVFVTLRQELHRAYGRAVNWKTFSARTSLEHLRAEVALVERGEELVWRSVYASIPDSERQAIFLRLAPEDQEQFQKIYQVFLSFHAPVPLFKAKKLLNYVDSGKIVIVSEARGYVFDMHSGKFKLMVAANTDSPDPEGTTAARERLSVYPIQADVYVCARGPGRDAKQVPLFRKLAEDGGIVEINPRGGIRVDLNTRRVITRGKMNKGLYAIGHPSHGETVLTFNSTTISQAAVELGLQIISSVLQKARTRPRGVGIMSRKSGMPYDRGSLSVAV